MSAAREAEPSKARRARRRAIEGGRPDAITHDKITQGGRA